MYYAQKALDALHDLDGLGETAFSWARGPRHREPKWSILAELGRLSEMLPPDQLSAVVETICIEWRPKVKEGEAWLRDLRKQLRKSEG